MTWLGGGTIEKQLARRQLTVKGFEGNSWYVAVRKLLLKYKLPDCWDIVENLISKFKWKRMVNSQVEEYLANEIRQKAFLYSSPECLNIEDYRSGKKHWLIQHICKVRDVSRLRAKLKLVTGTYTLQVNRAKFNQSEVDPTCMVCRQDPDNNRALLADMSHIGGRKATYVRGCAQYNT